MRGTCWFLIALMVHSTMGQPTTNCLRPFEETCSDIHTAQQILFKLDALTTGSFEQCNAPREGSENLEALTKALKEYQSVITTKLYHDIVTKLEMLQTATDGLQLVSNETKARVDELSMASEASSTVTASELNALTAVTEELVSSHINTMTVLREQKMTTYKLQSANNETKATVEELSIALEASWAVMTSKLDALTMFTEEIESSHNDTMTILKELKLASDELRSAGNDTTARVDQLSVAFEASMYVISAKLDALTSAVVESRSSEIEQSTKLDTLIEDSRNSQNLTKLQLDGLSTSSSESQAVTTAKLDAVISTLEESRSSDIEQSTKLATLMDNQRSDQIELKAQLDGLSASSREALASIRDALTAALDVSHSNHRDITERLDEMEKNLNLTVTAMRRRPFCGIHGEFLNTNTYQYKFVQDKVTWYEARDLCHRCGFRLMQYQPTERQTIFQWLQELGVTGHVWMDGSDEGHEGCWVWTDHSLSPFTSGRTRWRSGEPNNSNDDDEHCADLVAGRNMQWNDHKCINDMPYLCQRSITADPLETLPLPNMNAIRAARCT